MGISMNDVFPSKWLKAADISGDTNITITHVTMEQVGQNDHKPVAWLQGYDKGVVLNKTNFGNIAGLYGDDTDLWVGKSMTMTRQWVDFQGKSTESIRLYPPRTTTQPPQGNDGFVSGQPDQPANSMNGDPRGDVPAATDQANYGDQRG